MKRYGTEHWKFILLVTLVITNFSSSVFGAIYYSRQSGLNWNNPLSWSTVTYGMPVNTGTFPRAGDRVFIGNGHTIYIDNNAICDHLTIGNGSTGRLEFLDNRNCNVRVYHHLTINPTGTFIYNRNNNRAHWLYVGENLTNNGNMAFYFDGNDYVEISFNLGTSSIVDGTGTFNLNRVIMQKTTPGSNLLDMRAAAFESATRELILTSGYYIHNNTGNFSVNPLVSNFTIPKDVTVDVPSGTMHFAPNTNFLYLYGTLIVNGGTVRVGSNAGAQGFRYSQLDATIPRLIINSGLMDVKGGLTYRAVTPSAAFYFEMNGGQLLLNTGSPGSRNGVFNIIDNPNSSFIMNGGTITLEKPNRDSRTYPDFQVCGNTGTVNATMGFVDFGNANTPVSTFNFVPYPNAILPNFKVTGPAATAVKLVPYYNNVDNIILNSLYIDVNKTFDILAFVTNNGGSRQLRLAGSYDGMYTYYNDGTFEERTGTVLIESNEGLWLGGNVPTDFFNLNVNNFFGISIAQNINIINNLQLTDGIVSVINPYRLTCLNSGRANIGNSTAYVDGPFDQIIASTGPQTFNIPIGKSGAYRPIILSVQHTNITSVTYSSEMFNISARNLNYTLPPTLSRVSDVRYYLINRSPVANLSASMITLHYGADDGVTDFNALRVAQFNGSGAWIDEGGVGSANTTGYITSNTLSMFNDMFTLGNTTNGTNPLPVTLLDFKAVAQQDEVDLTWLTASEINSSHFEIERSIDNKNYLTLGNTLAAGNSTIVKSYQFTDEEPYTGTTYYRLKIVDLDGSFEYSPVRAVYYLNDKNLNVFPNPVTDENFSVEVPEFICGPVTLTIINSANQTVYEQTHESRTIRLESDRFAKGTYSVILNRYTDRFSGKIIVQ